MASVLENNRGADFAFHVLSRDLSDAAKKKISKLKICYKNFSVDYALPDEKLFDGLKLNINYISMDTYFRFAIADMFPEIKVGLYLDADLVCNGDMTELFAVNIDGFYAAGVSDLYIDHIDYKPKIGFERDELYVNAGVLLFNLEKIRKDKMTQKLFDAVKNNEIKFQDQDGLNIAFRSNVWRLDGKYNLTTSDYNADRSLLLEAKIIHFNGTKKPWDGADADARVKIWEKYAKIDEAIQNAYPIFFFLLPLFLARFFWSVKQFLYFLR
jgi:lipopolysaccharide biosynthesis glycosyltransferase